MDQASTSNATAIVTKEAAVQFAERLHGLLVSLTQHLALETEALKAGTWSRLSFDQDTKSELLHAYRDAHKRLQANQDAISRFVPVKLDTLRRLHEAFQQELQRNLATVSTAKAVSEHLLSRLAEQVSGQNQPKTYSAGGTMTKHAKAAALSVDRSL